jgi:hypothetical protein
MNKYSNALSATLSLFGTTAWTDVGVKAYPANFAKQEIAGEYIRIQCMTSGKGLNLLSVNGFIIIQIYTPAGDGPMRPYEIAGYLDTLLVGKTSEDTDGGTLQLSASAFSTIGLDKVDPTLYASKYTIPFNYFGVK